MKSKMPQELEKPEEQRKLSHQNQRKPPKKSPIYANTTSEVPDSWESGIHEQRSNTDPSNSVLGDCFGLPFMPAMVANCIANLPFCDQDSSYEQRQGMFHY